MPQLKHTASENFFLMAGPCIVESEQMCMDIAGTVKEITDRLQIPYIFKASFRKANRSRLDSFTGIGDVPSLEILRKVRERYQLPVVTDIHESHEAALAADYVDVLQIPAFLCRQTELLVAAARTGKTVNVKKGQFLSPESMKFAIDKIRQSGNNQVMVTERGTMLGYGDLVVDMRGIPEMKKFNVPVVMDVTHSLQQPNQSSGVTGGKPELISTIARAAMAAGADGIFIETHPNPAKALSDGANMLRLDLLEKLLVSLLKVQQAVR
ncbi:MAG TPA: 3-deoxy-8-phosphooctulonate synthase [Bacteroidia bacterium]|nr:3-deoxy-8-phosphooctulonate synthase [Bacteroidia bacterium]QQR96532.1 MAG: 3-deoxy-8-phosphooctulonate synthase [Bacteroidota bacterium]MBP7715382.1 3-deoxy-8-phosphooctulonate synthase [Bacteroidia bacterium]MBP8669138.1 3-deoxy-8-phosphooctulonate synthase [Bacteroidia bacterium]HOZ83248.1 3-deoxy-8-phosphooctulonate synthase [Bacteroidia bacterium]